MGNTPLRLSRDTMSSSELLPEIQAFSLPVGSLESVVFEGLQNHQLLKLRPLHYRILSLHLSGLKHVDISDQLGITRLTVLNVVHSRLGREVIEGSLEKYYDEFYELAPKVVKTIKQTLEDDDNPDLKLRAASMWLKTSGWEGRKKRMMRWDIGGSPYDDAHLDEPGTTIDFEEILGAFEESGYDGAVAVHQSPLDGESIEHCYRACYAYLTKIGNFAPRASAMA